MTPTAPAAPDLTPLLGAPFSVPVAWLDMNARMLDAAMRWQVALWQSAVDAQAAWMQRWQEQFADLPFGMTGLRGAEQLA